MKKLTAILSANILLIASILADERSSLATEMRRLGVRSVLIVASEAVDSHPVWSPKGDALAVNIEGRWMKVNLVSPSLVEGTWRQNQPIGVARPSPQMLPMKETTVRTWEKSARYGIGRVETPNGTTVELKQQELSTEFIITKKGAEPETLWKSGLESCHGLALSPDEQYVAFVCEQNGVVITAL